MAHYLDTSALTKLVVDEPETAALRAWLGESARDPITCDLARTELVRALHRVAPGRIRRARAVLEAVNVRTLRTTTFEHAGRLEPIQMRALDAIHLAAALDLGDDLEGIVTYDARLAAAAEAHGILVMSPS